MPAIARNSLPMPGRYFRGVGIGPCQRGGRNFLPRPTSHSHTDFKASLKMSMIMVPVSPRRPLRREMPFSVHGHQAPSLTPQFSAIFGSQHRQTIPIRSGPGMRVGLPGWLTSHQNLDLLFMEQYAPRHTYVAQTISDILSQIFRCPPLLRPSMAHDLLK